MSDENLPTRPEGTYDSEERPASGSMPRVEVEPTPSAPDFANDAHRDDAPRSYETVKHTVVKTKTKKLPVFIAAFGGFVLGAILIVALVMSGAFVVDRGAVQVDDATVQSIKIDPEDTTLPEVVAAKAQPSVVSIMAMGEQSGMGSGVVLDDKGNVLTNHHVVAGAQELMVSMGDASYEAELVGDDPSSDLAVVRIKGVEADALHPIELGDSDNLTVGEWVMAIGSPFGNEQSVSTGIVSALYRSTALPNATGTSIYANMIQTDAAINPGNSGGALVNDQGELIGINSIIESLSGSSSGVGFAIPVNYAVNIANQIIDGKTPVHPYLGVTLSSVNAMVARQYDLSASEGALILEVVKDGPAATAGIEAGDVVIGVDGEAVASADGLIIALRERNVGDKVKLTVMRGKEHKDIEVELGSDEALQAEQQDNAQGNGSGNAMTEEDFLRYLEELLGRGETGSAS